jgi:hypothetical protein
LIAIEGTGIVSSRRAIKGTEIVSQSRRYFSVSVILNSLSSSNATKRDLLIGKNRGIESNSLLVLGTTMGRLRPGVIIGIGGEGLTERETKEDDGDVPIVLCIGVILERDLES